MYHYESVLIYLFLSTIEKKFPIPVRRNSIWPLHFMIYKETKHDIPFLFTEIKANMPWHCYSLSSKALASCFLKKTWKSCFRTHEIQWHSLFFLDSKVPDK